MALYKIGDIHPNYRETYFNGQELKGKPVYSAESHKVGTVSDVLIDEASQPQYLVVEAGSRKKVLLPVSRCADLSGTDRIYVGTLNRDEFGTLTTYDDRLQAEPGQAFETYQMTSLEQSANVEMSPPVERAGVVAVQPEAIAPPPHTLQRTESPSIVEESVAMPEPQDRPIQLYEERLSTQKHRVKTGEVRISKRTITESANTAVPVTKEKVIIEIESVYGGETRVDFGDAQVGEDGSVRMDIYEEQAEVCRRVEPYQNVSVRKEVVQDVVRIQEPLRREELAVSSDGNPQIDWVNEADSSTVNVDRNREDEIVDNQR